MSEFLLPQQKNHLPPFFVETEATPVIPSMAFDVARIKRSGEEDLYGLKDTGFQVKTQIDLLLENYKNGIPLSNSFQQLEQDIQGFKTEYLVELPVFPIVLEKALYKGEMRLVGKLYGGKPVVDATDDKERHGAVKKSIKKIEEKLIDAPAGTMAVMTSPKGWSGYEGITYPDSQTYCFEVQEDGGIRGFTLKTDMSLSQNKELLMNLGVPKNDFKEEKDAISSIKEVVSNVAFIPSENGKKIEDIVQIIKHIKGDESAYKDSSGKSRTFNEMINHLKNPEHLWTLDSKTRRLIDDFREYASYRFATKDSLLRQDLGTGLGYTVLKLMHEIRMPQIKGKYMEKGKVYDPAQKVVVPFNARDTLENLKKIGGCAGGGNKNKIGDPVKQIINSITPRLGSTNLFEDEGQEWFTCPKCSFKADGPVGNQCPGCKITMEEYAQEEGAVVCA
ncbi:MAG TPA: hypothetical protein PKA38_00850 [Candidatus Levybacteria bacterium]|nr:hypothetical protein [Candidatus Levybacteria bacterium]